MGNGDYSSKYFRASVCLLAIVIAATVHLNGKGQYLNAGFATLVVLLLLVSLLWLILGHQQQTKVHISQKQYPLQYVVNRGSVPEIDGDLNKKCWEETMWSDSFGEIRGRADAPSSTWPSSKQRTRFKMLWDDEYLYIAAALEYDVNDPLVASYVERNSPIFHQDSDFEVFIDPTGCCHNYKELEMNALNTVWNLMLNRPYSVGGSEYSGRIAKEGDERYWEVNGQRTAVKVKGKVGDGNEEKVWHVEIALAHTDTLSQVADAVKPKVGSHWRINFSRVENKGTTNWTWAPQLIWDPALGRYVGKVNMHLPTVWGYVIFADSRGQLGGSPADKWRDPAWTVRHIADCVSITCRHLEKTGKKVPKSVNDLVNPHNVLYQELLDGAVVSILDAVDADGGRIIKVEKDNWVCTLNNFMRMNVWHV